MTDGNARAAAERADQRAQWIRRHGYASPAIEAAAREHGWRQRGEAAIAAEMERRLVRRGWRDDGDAVSGPPTTPRGE